MVVRSFLRHKFFFIAVSILFFALFAHTATAGPHITPEDREKLSAIVSEEFLSVTEFLSSIDKDALPRVDYEFYEFWLKGLEKERSGRPADSIIFYKKALEVDRDELSTYEILFSLGRGYFLIGQKDNALSALQEFIKNAEHDLSESGPWPLTAEGEQVMRKKIAYAKWIIDLCNRSDK
jgi:tetratricopeptide (TPR) repeat protein